MKLVSCFLIIISLFFVSCKNKKVTIQDEERLYLKELHNNSYYVQWFFYSYITSESPDYILIKNSKNKEDTITLSTNIADIDLENDSIKISFYGKPMKYDKETKVNIKQYPIKIDTTIISSGPTVRKFYRK